MKPKLTAKRFSVRVRDLLKGLLMAVGTTIFTLLQKFTDTAVLGDVPVFPTWKLIAMAAVASAATYILRKFLIDDVKLAEKTLNEAKENE